MRLPVRLAARPPSPDGFGRSPLPGPRGPVWLALGLILGGWLNAAAGQSDDRLIIRGQTLHRWSSGTLDLAYLVGDCEVARGDTVHRCNTCFAIVDGSGTSIRARILIDCGETTPRTATVRLTDVPDYQSDRYLGQTDVPAAWWGLLGEPIPIPAASQSAVAQVQFQQPILGQPTLPPGGLRIDPPLMAEFDDVLPPPIRSLQPSVVEPSPGSMAPPFGPPLFEPPGGLPPADLPPPAAGGFQFFVGGGTRSIELTTRDTTVPLRLQSIDRQLAGEQVYVGRGGVTVIVRDVTANLPDGALMTLGNVTLSADNVVAYAPPIGDLLQNGVQGSGAEGELYLEGNIVLRQGDSVIYAEAMYYNAVRGVGVILDAEAIVAVPQLRGVIRVKADRMRQLARDTFVADSAAVTSSRIGVPRYWLQSGQVRLFNRAVAAVDPISGLPTTVAEPTVASESNFVYLAGVPVFYYPRFQTPLRKPSFYLRGADFKNDDIFGTQVLLEWDLFQLLGLQNPPDGVDTVLLTDYLSDRGPAFGNRTTYSRASLFGIPGPVVGRSDSYTIFDDGLDNLGLGRQNLTPEEDIRGRTTLRHRHYFAPGWEAIAELGYISDRNFVEQYFEQEWDRESDRRTGVRLRRYLGPNVFDLSLYGQINEFFQETEQLPTLDHYAMGLSPLNRLTWSMHNEVGYQKLNPAEFSSDPQQNALTGTRLPGEFGREGIVARTRQEISLPVDLGPVRLAPFAIGEAAAYGEAVDGESLSRFWGGGGIRGNLPFSRIDPTITSSLLNVNGLAHKVNLSAEYFYADSDTDLDELPLYDPLDDNAQEQFRRFFSLREFGGGLPARLDPRTMAFRRGAQRYIAGPSDTIVDDLQQVRLGIDNRFQTKRGLPGRQRIVDLFEFDVETILFPEADRDNFGETVGPTTYDAAYHLGDRVAILSDGYFDWFDDGLRSVSAGVRSSRPGLGDFYAGILSLQGPIDSTVLRSIVNYRLNEKWIFSGGTTYDFGDVGSVGQSASLTRIGESFLVQVGATVDSGRDNVSFGFTVEPRFLPRPTLGLLGGQLIPPPGSEGLE